MSHSSPHDLIAESSLGADPAASGISPHIPSPARPAADRPYRILDSARPPKADQARSDFIHHRLFALGDLLAVVVAAAVAGSLAVSVGRNLDAGTFILAVGMLTPVWFFIAYFAGLYHDFSRQIDQNYVDEVPKIAMAATVWCWAFVLLRSILVVGETDLLTPALLWVLMIPLLLFSRSLVRKAARKRSWNIRSVATIGDVAGVTALARRIARHGEWGLDVRLEVALDDDRFFVREGNTSDEASTDSFPTVVRLEPGDRSESRQIAEFVEGAQVDRVLIAGGSQDLMTRTELIHELVDRGITVDQITGGPETLYSSAVLQHLEGVTVMTVSPSSTQPVGLFFKRALDVAVSLTGLILASPVLLAAAIVIKLGDRGPVFFRQAREGKDGKPFQILKLRTMVDGADLEREKLKSEGIHGDTGMLKLQADPRITKAGRFLRNSSIDELPQLWNVLTGDMSLVGPRPLPLDETCLIDEGFSARQRVRPGITGPWQVMGRSEIPMEDMVRLDYTYVVGWSLQEDFRVLLRTASAVFGRKGVY